MEYDYARQQLEVINFHYSMAIKHLLHLRIKEAFVINLIDFFCKIDKLF